MPEFDATPKERSFIESNKVILIICSWILVLVAPVCIMLHQTPEVVKMAMPFTISGIALNWWTNYNKVKLSVKR